MFTRKVLPVFLIVLLALLLGVQQGTAQSRKATIPNNLNPNAPLGKGFTYQGVLKNSAGNPLTSACDFTFRLWNAESGGAQIGADSLATGVSVTSGYFTAQVNTANEFGANAFAGAARWLEVSVQCTGDAAVTTLSPRQALTAAPYARYAESVGAHSHWGDSWSGSGTGLTLSGGQVGVAAGGSTVGVYGASDTTTGVGVYGRGLITGTIGIMGTVTSTSGTAGYFTNTSGSGGYDVGWGVRAFTGAGSSGNLHPGSSFYPGAGEFAGPNGVIGGASDDASDGYGVIGVSGGAYGVGVYGFDSSITGSNSGVYGVSVSTSGVGVYGLADSASGSTYGVYGQSDSTSGSGLYGYAAAIAGPTYGVFGESDSTDGYGVFGDNIATTGYTYGVYGETASTGGTGVFGAATATTGTTYGVYGYIDATSGAAIFGIANMYGAYTTAGVYGQSDASNGYGVAGHAFYAGVGVGAWSYSGNLIEAFAGDYPDGTLEFYIDPFGDVYANGTYYNYKTSSLDGATHAMASIQSPEVWVEDFGRASLVDGKATVTIAPDFAGVANLTAEYNVFLTPLGDCLGLYVTNMTPITFEVRELNGGKSNIAFSYRIVAKQAGSETIRLPEVTIPTPVETTRQPDNGVQSPVVPQPAKQGQTSQGQQP